MPAGAVADVEVDGDFQFERQKIGNTPIDRRRVAEWLVEHDVDEVAHDDAPGSCVWCRSCRLPLTRRHYSRTTSLIAS